MGLTARVDRRGRIFSVADLELVPSVAVIEAEVLAVTAVVVTTNVPTLVPAGTVTLAGTTAWVLLEASVTTEPPAGAFAERVTFPLDPVPPTTVEGVTLTELTVCAIAGGADRRAAPRATTGAKRPRSPARGDRREAKVGGKTSIGIVALVLSRIE